MNPGSPGRAAVSKGPHPLLERERELAALSALLDGAAAGTGSVALVEGPAGIGKTRLIDALAETADARGINVTRASGGELERDLSWAAVRELFERGLRGVGAERRESMLSGAAALARPVLESDDAASGVEGADRQLASALHGLYWLAADLAGEKPLAMLIDDAHWIDTASLEFLAYLARRTRDLPLVLVLAVRSGEASPQPEQISAIAAGAQLIQPDPLSRDAVGKLLAATIENEADGEFADACREATSGNPFLLQELLAEIRQENLAPSAANAGRIADLRPDAVRRSMLVRLASLPESAWRLAEGAAILGADVSLAFVAELVELPLDQAAELGDALSSAQIFAAEGGPAFAHPILRGVVLEEIPPGRTSELHRRAATQLIAAGSGEDAARHLLLSEPAGDAQSVRILCDQAELALGRGAPANAVSYLTRALSEPPAEVDRPALLAQLSAAEAIAGDVSAIAHMQTAVELTGDDGERLALTLQLGTMLGRLGRNAEAAKLLDGALSAVDDPSSEIALAFEAAYLSFAWQDAARAGDARRREGDFLARGESTHGQLRRAVLAQSALGRTCIGESAAEVVALCEELMDDPATLEQDGPDSLTPWTAIGCLSWADALDEAEHAIELTLEQAQKRLSPVAIAHGFYARSWPRYWRGQVADAAADAEAAVAGWEGAWEMMMPAARYWLGAAFIELDELDRAAAAFELEGEQRWAGSTPLTLLRAGRASLKLVRGEFDAAYDELRSIGAEAEQQFAIPNPAMLPWRSLAASAACALGRHEEARSLADVELERARGFGAWRPIGIALRACGMATPGTEGIALLEDSVSALEHSPAKLELCRSRVELGTALRRAGDRRAAREQLRRGLDLAERLGAIAISRRAREELAASGAKLRNVQISGPDSLTPSERRVADLAVAGNSNREIAQQLFVSLRTVETHLTHVYQKLEISSRAELAGALS